MNTQVTIESEMKRRMDLVNNPDFVKSCVESAKKLGITAQEWNENKAMLCLYFANQICSMENKELAA
jgi:hypothetical protein